MLSRDSAAGRPAGHPTLAAILRKHQMAYKNLRRRPRPSRIDEGESSYRENGGRYRQREHSQARRVP